MNIVPLHSRAAKGRSDMTDKFSLRINLIPSWKVIVKIAVF